jgi:hypothetical protein
MNDTVVAIVSAFFVIGIMIGVIAVVAMSVLRAERRRDPSDLLDYEPRRCGGQSPDRHWDNDDSDDNPRWPGRADNDFSGR